MRSKVIRFYLILMGLFCLFGIEALAQDISYDIRTSTGRYIFSYEEIPASLVPVDPGATAISYSWERSPYPLFSHDVVVVANTATYNISTPMAKTTYFRRKVTLAGSAVVYSNIIKIEIASKYRENFNYVREHEVLVSGKTDWKEVDQLPIGDKLQTTTYMDGLGRPIQKVSKETATPATGSSQWGDIVQFFQYDAYGREAKQYLPYTTTAEPGKFKTNAETAQAHYYVNK